MHLQNAHFDLPDAEGLQLADLAAARSSAIASIRDLFSHEAKGGKLDLRGHVDIEDDDGRVLMTVQFAEAISIIPR